ncbi:MAG TPA: hypothetical protein VFK97_01015 [Candidatus Saccharimonadales bacterium]|nr:hypothetical protein [Candidatus Saccharimonadales bacterium]
MNPTQPSNQPTGAPAGAVVGGPDGPAVIPPRQSASNANSTQNALQISEIRDGIVIMNDGTFRAVVMCRSINFDLMSPQEREAVEFSYQGFLNSLYFPVQIFVRSQKVDMRPYLEKLYKIRTGQENMLLGLLMEDYIAFLDDIVQQTNIMDKKFYLVIKFPDAAVDVRKTLKQSTSFFSGLLDLFKSGKDQHITINEAALEEAKTELKHRVQAVMQGLAQCGVQSLPLDTEELIELYYDAYNPDTATRQQIKDFKALTAPVITKGEGEAPKASLDGSTA